MKGSIHQEEITAKNRSPKQQSSKIYEANMDRTEERHWSTIIVQEFNTPFSIMEQYLDGRPMRI